MGSKLVNKATGQAELVEDADLPTALASGKYIAPDAVAAHAGGQDTYQAPEQFMLEHSQGLSQAIDPSQIALEQGHAAREKANTGIVATGKAVAGGAIGALSFGTVDPFQEEQEFNRGASLVGTGIGLVAPGLVGDELGLSKLLADPAETERVASSLSSRALFAGDVGAETGTAARTAERGLAGARTELEAGRAAASVPEDLAGLDAKGLRQARETELDRLAGEQGTARAAAKSKAVDDVLAYRQAVKDANPWLVLDEGQDASRLNKANRTLRNALDDAEGLRESPGSLLKPLRVEAKALENSIARQEEIAAKLDKVNAKIADGLAEDLATLPDAATEVTLEGKAARRYAAYADVKVGKNASVKIAREEAQGFLEALQRGEIQGESGQALAKLPALLDQNRALQASIKEAIAPAAARGELTSARIAAIADAQDALSAGRAGRKASIVEDMLGGSIMGHVAGALSGMPIVGKMLGAKAGQLAKDLVFGGGLGKAAGEQFARTGRSVRAFLDTAARTAPITAPIVASKILASVSYAPKSEASIAAAPKVTGKKSGKQDLATLFNQRAAEIRSQTAYGPDGVPVMTPSARQQLGARLAPIRALSPELADKLETVGARRIEFLSSKLPRRPDAGLQIGPDTHRTSDMEMRTFARYAHAVEDPGAIEERLANGAITPEDAEAYAAVYPERLAALTKQIVAELPKLQKNLPPHRRMALSMLTGISVDPALDPMVLSVLQASFAGEDGTEGGTQAPTAKPQFGSVRADIGTPSQQREATIR